MGSNVKMAASNEESTVLEAMDAFKVTVNGVWAAVIAGRLTDDDGWAAIGDALTELREETEH